jgi:hypothetical protein
VAREPQNQKDQSSFRCALAKESFLARVRRLRRTPHCATRRTAHVRSIAHSLRSRESSFDSPNIVLAAPANFEIGPIQRVERRADEAIELRYSKDSARRIRLLREATTEASRSVNELITAGQLGDCGFVGVQPQLELGM